MRNSNVTVQENTIRAGQGPEVLNEPAMMIVPQIRFYLTFNSILTFIAASSLTRYVNT